MSRIIEAKAVISAADQTGNVFDRLAAKIKGVEKTAKSLGNIPAPKFTGDFSAEIKRLQLSEKQLQEMRMRQLQHMDALRAARPKAEHWFRSVADWQSKEVAHWRRVRIATDEAAAAQQKFAERRNRLFGAMGGGAARLAAMAGGAYAVARAGRAGITAAGVGQRESARDYLAGMTDEESKKIESAARASSGRYQSVDSSTMHERLRDTAMSMRSGDKAIELADTIAQGTTVLQSLKGKDKAIEEGRKFFSALDVLGKNIDPKEVKELWNGYIKALGVEGADMDLGGVLAFARQSRAAGGLLSNRFLMTTMPGLARDLGDAQLGTSLSSALNQNIGTRATKQALAGQKEFGLRDEQGKFIQDRLAMSDPDRYAWEVLMPALKKKGVDVDDDLAVTKALTKVFSNRTVQDVFSKLINQRQQYQGKAEQYARAPGLSAAGPLMQKDPFVAYEALFAQLRTLASQAPIMNAAAAALNSMTTALANLNKFVETGVVPEDTRGGRLLKGLSRSVEETNERHRIQGMEAQSRELDEKLRNWNLDEATNKNLRLKNFELRSGIDAAKNLQTMPSIFSDAEKARWAEQEQEMQRERNRGRYGGAGTPLPPSDPRRGDASGIPPVQSLEGASVRVEGDVKGEVEGTFRVEAGSELLRIVESVKQLAIEVRGKLSSLGGNGPGSTGRSSPDANAPGDTGLSSGVP
jgi:hypothetical protein